MVKLGVGPRGAKYKNDWYSAGFYETQDPFLHIDSPLFTTMSHTRVPLILVCRFRASLRSLFVLNRTQGASGFGDEGAPAVRISDIPTAQKAVDIFVKGHGQKYIDTSRIYAAGTSEKVFCEVEAVDRKTSDVSQSTVRRPIGSSFGREGSC